MSVAADSFIAENWKYLIAALALHFAIALLAVVAINTTSTKVAPPQLAIKATIVDNSAQRQKREREAAAAKRQEEEREQEKLERERVEAETQAREEAEKRQQAEAEATKRIEQQRAEEKRQQAATDQKKKAEAQKATAAKKAADDKKRVAEIKSKQEEKLRTEREAREQAQRENELKRQLAEEEGRTQAQKSGLLSQYMALIQQRVVRNWNKPASARAGIQCDVKVTQAPGGTVLSVQVDRCNGDQAVRQSIEAAVYRSSPLPPPEDARLFERVILFQFKPED
jgi:colicin import membrane protein